MLSQSLEKAKSNLKKAVQARLFFFSTLDRTRFYRCPQLCHHSGFMSGHHPHWSSV